MILLWGLPSDSPLAEVYDRLHNMDCLVEFLDQRQVGEAEIQLRVESCVEGKVRTGARWIDLASVTAAYIRPYESFRLPSVARSGKESPQARHAVSFDDTLLSWADITPARVVNRPSDMASNNSKPYQAQQIRALGFDTPDTLVTTDPSAVEDFWAQHGRVIYKSVSGTRSIVSQLTPKHAARLADVCWCPTQFQEYIAGNDYRVHVVGDAVFATEIASAADDYRYAGRENLAVDLRVYNLPASLEEQCRKVARGLGLRLAGIDLRQTPEGRWYCFEVNPSPGFTYYEEATGQPIAEAVARLLVEV